MAVFKMTEASRVVRFLANDKSATWEPTSEGGVIVHHTDYDQPLTKQNLIEAQKTYVYEISRIK